MTGRPTFNGGVHLVADTLLCGGLGVVDTVRSAVDGGISLVQIRDKTSSDTDFYDLVMRTADAVGDRVLLLVNDRIEVFLAARSAGAAVQGVHIGQGDMSPLQARRMVGADAVIGLSANTGAHITAAHRLPESTVDYLGIGVIRPTTTKPNHPPALGVFGFGVLAGLTPLPCVAIGGIALADLPELRRVGAAGAAVVSAICATSDPQVSAQNLIAAWHQ